MDVSQHLQTWLFNYRSHLLPAIEQRQQEVARQSHQIIATADADTFITDFAAGIFTGTPLFLANPAWGQTEWQQVKDSIVQVDRERHRHHIMIPTGGTTGHIKFAIHTPTTLTAAALGFQQFYQVSIVHSYCILPLHHVSGLMQLWRSVIGNGQFWTAPPHLSQPLLTDAFISLVPTQLQRLLVTQTDWLRQFRAVILGGAPAWPTLLAQAQSSRIPLSISYGLTETAAMVTALRPADFLAGHQSSGQALPHAHLQVLADRPIAIRSPALMLGYYPHCDGLAEFVTDDLGVLDEQGYLQILGRDSHKIITGGENVWPAEVEAAIRATGLVTDVYVLGIPDPEWGEKVVAIYCSDVELGKIQTALSNRLSKFKQPKTWLAVSNIPRNSQGKVDRQWCQNCYQQHQLL